MYRFQFTRCFVVFCALASLLLSAPASSTAAPSEISLLKPASTYAAAPAVQKPVNTSLVSRMRTVVINPDILNIQTSDAIQMNLFEDARYRATRVRSQQGAGGSLLWTGTISGAENGHVVIVAKDQQVCASIVLASAMYQIRPVGQGLHMVRQIRKEALTRIESAPSEVTPGEARVIQLVNQERVIEGLPPLHYSDRLYDSARNHSLDMAAAHYCSHDSRNGRKFFERIFASGYPISRCGENIAHGFSSPEEVFEGWMNSPGHRVNIMSAEFTEIGVGYACDDSTRREYWTQDFGAGRKPDAGQGMILAGGSSDKVLRGFGSDSSNH